VPSVGLRNKLALPLPGEIRGEWLNNRSTQEDLFVADWAWWLLIGFLAIAGLFVLLIVGIHTYYRVRFLEHIVRIFEEKPVFILPRGLPPDDAEDVAFESAPGLLLRGCYLKARGSRKGVILFGLEFGSNRWAASSYCSRLREEGYDIFAYEPRNQGESSTESGYAPLHWVTDRDLIDGRAALAYLRQRADASPTGIGILGVSKGGGVGLLLAAENRWVKCVATDGAYGAYTTMVPYMRRWVSIYSPHVRLQKAIPGWLYGTIGTAAMNRSASRRHVRFLSVERAARRMRQPLFMIHGEADTYIKPEMARTIFGIAGSKAKHLWLVPKAKHNQALNTVGEEYHSRLVAFFDTHLAVLTEPGSDSSVNPQTDTPMPVAEERLAAVGLK